MRQKRYVHIVNRACSQPCSSELANPRRRSRRGACHSLPHRPRSARHPPRGRGPPPPWKGARGRVRLLLLVEDEQAGELPVGEGVEALVIAELLDIRHLLEVVEAAAPLLGVLGQRSKDSGSGVV